MATLAEEAVTGWGSPVTASTLMWAFIPKYHWWPFLVCFISRSHCLALLLVDPKVRVHGDHWFISMEGFPTVGRRFAGIAPAPG